MKPGQPFADLLALAAHLRGELENKKTILLYAYNGTGKTRLSMAFKNIGKQGDARDTLYSIGTLERPGCVPTLERGNNQTINSPRPKPITEDLTDGSHS